MSRVIVKGIPKYLTEDKLKDHFGKRLATIHKGENISESLTDVKILKNRAGESRRFAFVGFKSEEDAFDAVNYFDQSFIDTSKIEVSMAKSFADPRVPQPMREKRREALKRLHEREEQLLEDKKAKKQQQQRGPAKHNLDAEIKSNTQLQEFLDTMKPSAQVTSWDNLGGAVQAANDAQNTVSSDAPQGNSLLAQALAMKTGEPSGNFKVQENESDDEYTMLNNKANDGGNEDGGEEEQMVKLDDFEDKTKENMAQDEKVSDFNWLKQHRIRIKENTEGTENTDPEGVTARPKSDIREEDNVESTEDPESTEQQESKLA